MLLFALDMASAKLFGEAEFWFSMVKIITIVGVILIGALVLLPIAGVGPEAGPSLANLYNDGGFFATGPMAALLSLQIVVFAFVGVELIGLTAGQAKDPKVTLRKTASTLPFRIGAFYIGALVVILSVRGWRAFSEGKSPFVEVFTYIGIPGAAGIIASAATMAIGVLVNIVSPEHAFAYVTSMSTIGIIIVWGSILLCHMVYRRRVAAGTCEASDFRLPGAPITTVLALAFLALVLGLLFFTSSGRTALLVGSAWIASVSIAYYVRQRRPKAVPIDR